MKKLMQVVLAVGLLSSVGCVTGRTGRGGGRYGEAGGTAHVWRDSYHAPGFEGETNYARGDNSWVTWNTWRYGRSRGVSRALCVSDCSCPGDLGAVRMRDHRASDLRLCRTGRPKHNLGSAPTTRIGGSFSCARSETGSPPSRSPCP